MFKITFKILTYTLYYTFNIKIYKNFIITINNITIFILHINEVTYLPVEYIH